MKIFNKMGSEIANILAQENIINEKEIHIYSYTYIALFEQTFFWLSILLIGFILQKFTISSFFFVTIISLRSFAGGIHAPNPTLCTFLSYSIFILVLTLVPYLCKITNCYMFSYLFCIELLLIYIFSPIDTINRPLNQQRRQKMHFQCGISCIFLLLLFYLLLCFQFKNCYITMFICVTIILIGQLVGILQNKNIKGDLIYDF